MFQRVRESKKEAKLLDAMAFYGYTDLFKKAVEEGFPINHCQSEGPLYWALAGNRDEIVKFLLEKRANVNHRFRKRTILSYAAERLPDKAALTLIAAGAFPEGYHSETPLHYAVKRKSIKVAQALIDARADVDAVAKKTYYRFTPLAVALERKNPEMIRVLLNAGANPKGNGCFLPSDAGCEIVDMIKEAKNG